MGWRSTTESRSADCSSSELTSWIFGREFSGRTAADLLAVPTPRAAIVTAKFVVIAAWSAVLTGTVLVSGLVVGLALGLPGWSPDLLTVAVRDLTVLSGMSMVLVTPIALAASLGRGYLPAVGLILLVTGLAQVFAAVGVGAWFPWSVPALAGGIAGPVAAEALGPGSYLLVGVTAFAGALLTVAARRSALIGRCPVHPSLPVLTGVKDQWSDGDLATC